jgi:hypothetical protein
LTLETLQPVVARLGATVTEVIDAVPPVAESVPAIVTDVADIAGGVVDVALQPVGTLVAGLAATTTDV